MWMNAFPFGIMNLLKSTLGIETRIISEVGLVTIDLGGDLAGEIRPPHTHSVFRHYHQRNRFEVSVHLPL